MNVKIHFTGIGFITSIFMSFLKIIHLIETSWFVVLLPALIDIVILFIILLVFFIFIKKKGDF